nr:hypothetical protein [Okeania hirsuta]
MGSHLPELLTLLTLSSALSDQKAEYLMAQQLQRWGREVLYEESLAITADILKLR